MAHTKIASQTSFKGLFLQKVGTKLHVLRFCMSKPNFLQKKHIMIDFLFFLPICLCCNLSICSTKVSVFKVFGGRYIYSIVCLFAYLCYITLIHLQMT